MTPEGWTEEAVREASVVVAEFPGLADLRGEPVRFAVRHHPQPDTQQETQQDTQQETQPGTQQDTQQGTWLVELGPHLLGIARPADVRALAEGILDVLERGSGEPDFTLYDDGYAEAQMTVGYDGDELYFTAAVAFDPARDFVGSSPSGEPLYRNPFGTAYLEFRDVTPADPALLTRCAYALLAVLAAGPDDDRNTMTSVS
ncbi:hypothetical protein [Streptomyces sp. NPDC051214]|uniref:hypothetical protein n=1 Tax=Streptomyces sp. NPDC051214 TaxID=3155282 RepID=UPI00342D9064